MKRLLRSLVLFAVASCAGVSAGAQQRGRDFGRTEYESSCAVCHGATLRGDGPMRPFLLRPPSDLATLAARNGGTFPTQRVAEMIDGRSAVEIGSHGTRDMPVWGQIYLEQAMDNPGRMQIGPEWHVRARIVALIDYLARMQAK